MRLAGIKLVGNATWLARAPPDKRSRNGEPDLGEISNPHLRPTPTLSFHRDFHFELPGTVQYTSILKSSPDATEICVQRVKSAALR